MNNHKPIIAVVGATGAQGGGLIRAILADRSQRFSARAITRDPNNPAARELARLGAEVVGADVDDAASLERAFSGAEAAFCVTFYWAHLSPKKEIAHAQNLARAAKRAAVKHVIWSTLEDTRRLLPLSDPRMPTLLEEYNVPHFDAKGSCNSIFAELGLPTTYLYTSFYWENLIYFGLGPKRGPDGTLAFTLPMGHAKLPGIAAEDIGRSAYALFLRDAATLGQSFGIAGEHLSGGEMARALSHALGEPVLYDDIAPAAFRAFAFPGADDLGNMFQFKRDFEQEFRARRDLHRSRELNPGMQTFAEWLTVNARQIPLG
ncbi:MAG: NmrA/HSCARG family protein [Pseudomonadota bacterium]